MHRTSLVMTFVSLVLAAAPVLAAEPRRMTMEVEGQEREWLVFAPATAQAEPTPVVFAFHGHGGSMQNTPTGRRRLSSTPRVCPRPPASIRRGSGRAGRPGT